MSVKTKSKLTLEQSDIFQALPEEEQLKVMERAEELKRSNADITQISKSVTGQLNYLLNDDLEWDFNFEKTDWKTFSMERMETMPFIFHSKIAYKLIERGLFKELVENFEKFEGANKRGIVDKLLDHRHFMLVLNNMEKFGLSLKEISSKLIGRDQEALVLDNLELFPVSDYKEIAGQFLKAKKGWRVAKDLQKFVGLNHQDFAKKMIENGEGFHLISFWENFKNTQIDAQDLVHKLIEKGSGQAVLKAMHKFKELDQMEIALRMIESNLANVVVADMDSLNLDHQILANKLIQVGQGRLVVINLERFKNINHVELVKKLLNQKTGKMRQKEKTDFGTFAELITSNSYYKEVVESLDKFSGIDHQEIADILMEAGELRLLVMNLHRFIQINQQKIVDLLMSTDYGLLLLVNNLSSFKGLNHQDIVNKMIVANQLLELANNLDKFQGVNLQAIAEVLYRKNLLALVKNLEKFKDLPGYIAEKILQTESSQTNAAQLVLNLSSFASMSQYVALGLVTAGFVRDVLQTKKEFWIECQDEEDKAKFEFLFDQTVPLKIRQAVETTNHLKYGTPEWLDARRQVGLSPMQAEQMQSANQIEFKNGRYELKDGFYSKLLEIWQPGVDEMIYKQLQEGGRLFGEKAMLRYLNRADLSLHDAMQFFPSLFSFLEKNKINAQQFGNIVLAQVAKDQAEYDVGSSYHKLAAVIQSLQNVEVSDLIDQLKSIEGIPQVDELVKVIGESEWSWKKIQKLLDVSNLLQKKVLLERLAKEENPKLKEYIIMLAFHPNISMSAVLQFWDRPATFLNIADVHAPSNLSQAKKPANYLSEPFLGLSAKNLRDSLVGRADEKESVMDRLQTIPPFAAEYVFSDEQKENLDNPEIVHRYLILAMGKSGRDGGEKVQPKAKNSKKLFQSIDKLLKGNTAKGLPDFIKLVGDVDILKEIKAKAPEVYDQIINLIFEEKFGMEKLESSDKYRLVIGKKSDPAMVVAGNDTASCMPFGSGKNNVYMFNPNCAQMVMQRLNSKGEWRTVAQSVLTVNQEISTPVSKLRDKIMQTEKLEELIDPADFNRPRFIACDNIEIAKNIEGQRVKEIGTLYRKFFREFLAKFGEKMGVSKSKVVVGKGYTPADLGFRNEKNNTVPLVPVTYSDNTADEMMVIDTGLEEKEEQKSEQVIRSIEVTDVFAVAHLESKAYQGEGAGYGLHKVQNNILGIKIANKFFNRPDLTLISIQSGKPAAAYLVAYEGVIAEQAVVYIDDMAAERIGHPAAGRLVLSFFDKYFKAYQEYSDFPPIVTSAREATSYKIIKSQAEKLARKRGLMVEVIEKGSYEESGHVMHDVIIIIAKNQQQLDAQKGKMQKLREEDWNSLVGQKDHQSEESFDELHDPANDIADFGNFEDDIATLPPGQLNGPEDGDQFWND